MTAAEILEILQRDVHSVVFATTDENGLPQTCVIDLMLADEGGLYFLTAKGKAFHRRLTASGFAALSGIKGRTTLSAAAISVRGAVRSIGTSRLEEIFQKNPYMARIYPTAASRRALEVFQLYSGAGEYFDLSQQPPFRQAFSFGGCRAAPGGYRIDSSRCTGCRACLTVCPCGCISAKTPCSINASHCIHCGNCLQACPAGAVSQLG
ncbi:4Fe-4S binding protein [Anaerofilum sp. BX8]|uniref:4Fe-4S binding protein n=1 Tax=Anaerofilum hominis TaxID=2763016 RepID=A0A923I797_9FIRM|nr:4Fe-4S binding protein [Anaerofilum hominis]MBC5580076.1 4Fe-4S binding protein [Anaerofilum hominis]